MPFATNYKTDPAVQIHYEVVGEGTPIVFHHGNGNRIDDWHSLGFVDALANDFQLILIDSRGYGKSSKPHDPKDYSLQNRADDTIVVLDALGIEKAHCLGGSIGASLCFILARFYPTRFSSFIFATPYFELFDATIKNLLLQGPTAYVEGLEALIDCKIDNEAIRVSLLANDTKALWAANSSEWFDYQDYIQYVAVPSLIYAGSEEPSVPDLQVLSQALPHNELLILEGLDHAGAYWQSEVTAPLIKAFIHNLDKSK